jgi:hypothetical protein
MTNFNILKGLILKDIERDKYNIVVNQLQLKILLVI